MKKIILLLIVLFCFRKTQCNNFADTIVEYKNVKLICSIDGKYYKVVDLKKPNQYLFFIDSISYKFEQKENIFGQNYLNIKDTSLIFICAESEGENKIYYWDIVKNKITLKESFNGRFYGYRNNEAFYGLPINLEVSVSLDGTSPPYIRPVYVLKKRNLKNKKDENILDLKDNEQKYFGIADIILFPNENNILICSGLLTSDAATENPKYYIFNLKSKELTDFKKENLEHYNKSFTHSGLSSSFYFDIENNLFIGFSIYNSKFDYLGQTLGPDCNTKICGYNILDNKLVSYNVISETDQKIGRFDYKKVIIPFGFKASLEIAYYHIYNSILLKDEDISKLDKHDLQSLINMIYAKYNYMFKEPYLQAYFNLYPFYKKVRENRKDSVDGLFNDTDKQNLEIINKLLRK
jgi:hypothetical protein